VTVFGVVMPNWNKERHVGRAIESVIAQTFPSWHLAVVDDGSTDNSLSEISACFDARISVAVAAHQGPGVASRKAIEMLRKKGVRYVGILDSDDALEPGAMAAVYAAYLDDPSRDVVYTQNWRVTKGALGETRERGRARAIRPGETALSTQEKEHTLPVNHWLTFKMETYDKTAGFAALPRHQDMDLIFKLEEVGNLHFLDEPLYRYNILADGLHTGKLVADFAPEVRRLARERRAAQHSRMLK
jgi:glycosyltransferase involved in cell wall biosynthesis